MLKKKLTVVACAAALVGAAVVATAADGGPHDKAIKARQAMFQTYAFNIGVLGGMAKGKRPYDADVAAEAAANLDAAANFGQRQYWPQGSDNQTPGNARTRALPEIWTTYPAIGEKSQALKDATAVMKVEAGKGLDQLKAAIGDVGASCKGCHDDYRAKKK